LSDTIELCITTLKPTFPANASAPPPLFFVAIVNGCVRQGQVAGFVFRLAMAEEIWFFPVP
jgi:hypothetical protein